MNGSKRTNRVSPFFSLSRLPVLLRYAYSLNHAEYNTATSISPGISYA